MVGAGDRFGLTIPGPLYQAIVIDLARPEAVGLETNTSLLPTRKNRRLDKRTK